jgi:hypothetical protein
VFPQRDYRELDSDERERYKQHRVRIKFDRASYEDVNEYAALIRAESPYMFLSEVKIEPNYPPKNRPYDPTTFDASFEVSSVEFLNPRNIFFLQHLHFSPRLWSLAKCLQVKLIM